MVTPFDHSALSDAKHAAEYKQPSDVRKIIRDKHVSHMKRIDQAGWLKNVFRKVDLMASEQKRKRIKEGVQ